MFYDKIQHSPIRDSSGASAARDVPRRWVITPTAAAFLTLGLSHVTEAADGDLDQSFGNGGRLLVDVAGNNDFLNAVAIQSDGKIVVAGRTQIRDADPAQKGNQSDGNIVVARFNTDGQPDTGFGTGTTPGVAATDLPVPGSNDNDVARSVVLQDDGKIVVVGFAMRGSNLSKDEQVNDQRQSFLAVVRYLRNGELDPTFGEGGIVTMNPPGSTSSVANDAALQPDGKLVVVGGVGGFCPTPMQCGGGNRNVRAFRSSEFLMARFNTDGSLDTDFGRDGNGFVRTNFVPDDGEQRVDDNAFSVLVLSDGKIVVGGTAGSVPNASPQQGDFALARYDQNGILDTSFGGDGKVMTDFGEDRNRKDEIADLAAVSQPDGSIKIVAAGTSTRDESFVFALARYNPDGSADAGFGRRANGTQMTNFPDGTDGTVTAVALTPGGKLLAAGRREFGDLEDAAEFALIRYQPNGNEDTTFGADVFGEDDLEPDGFPDGIKFQAFENDLFGTNTRAEARGIAVQPDGKIVLVGSFNTVESSRPNANEDFALARFDSAVILEDIILCQGRPATIIGTPGDDTGDRPLIGSSRDDVIASLGGKDTIIAQGGNDIICGGDGNDVVFGGSGSDRIEGNDGNDELVGELPFLDRIAGRDVLSGGRGNDKLFGGGGNDLLMGGAGRDVLVGEEGKDELLGGKGNDLINGGPGSDVVRGGSGRDRLVGDLPGERGDDRISGGSGDDVLFGGDGRDRMLGGRGADLILGEQGLDQGDGGSGQDRCVTVERRKSCRPRSFESPVKVPARPSFGGPSACNFPQCGG